MDINGIGKEGGIAAVKEAKLLEVFKHPNIIKYNEVYRTKKGKLCIVMEYADGGDLGNLIKG